jgi:hypothetical protein
MHIHTISTGQYIIFLFRVRGLGPLVVATMGGAAMTAMATCMVKGISHSDIYQTK